MLDKELSLRVKDINKQPEFEIDDLIVKMQLIIDLYQDWTNYLNDNYDGPIKAKTTILQGLK